MTPGVARDAGRIADTIHALRAGSPERAVDRSSAAIECEWGQAASPINHETELSGLAVVGASCEPSIL
jgi:hypothetical protein